MEKVLGAKVHGSENCLVQSSFCFISVATLAEVNIYEDFSAKIVVF